MLVSCTRCLHPLPVWVIKAGDSAMCPTCNADLMVRVFPALIASRPVLNPADLTAEADEASCFYHTTKRASSACVECGRFICALCAVEMAGGVRCPRCLTAPPSQTAMPGAAQPDVFKASLENRRVLWDSIALGAATLPAMMIWPALPGGLASIYISIRYWKRPSSLIPRTKVRFVLAILFSLLELAFFAALIFGMFYALSQRNRGTQ